MRFSAIHRQQFSYLDLRIHRYYVTLLKGNSVKEESWLKCDEGYAILNRAPFCFSANYSNLHKPSMPDGRPLEIHTEISVLEIADIDDIQRTMTVNMYLTLEWMENR